MGLSPGRELSVLMEGSPLIEVSPFMADKIRL
jgi:hypothetical protein